MNLPDVAPLQPPGRHAAPSAVTGCLVLCAFALPPAVYIGSFVLLTLDAALGWGLVHPLDDQTAAAFRSVYWPLEMLMERVADLAGYQV